MEDTKPRSRRWRFIGGGLVATLFCCVFVFPIGELCLWHATGQAWLDENANGIWDENEPPLEGVEFHTDYIAYPGSSALLEEVRTDYRGDADLWASNLDCSFERFLIYPEVPEGYQLTTKPSVVRSTLRDDIIVRFGFTYSSDTVVPTVTPRPPAPVCTTYISTIEGTEIRGDRLSVLSPAPDGSMWFFHSSPGCCATRTLVQYLPSTDEWREFPVPDLVSGSVIRSLEITASNEMWIVVGSAPYYLESEQIAEELTTEIMRHDGAEWEVISFEPYPFEGDPESLSISPDGTFWFWHQRDIFIFDPKDDSWMTLEAPGTTDYQYAEFFPDGRAIIVAETSVNSFDEFMLVYTSADEPLVPLGGNPFSTLVVEVAPDGSVWADSFHEGLQRFDLVTGEVMGLAFPNSIYDLAFGPDGSLWVASSSIGEPAIYQYVPQAGGEQEGTWRVYDERDGIPERFLEETDGNVFREVAWQNETTVWFREDTALVRCHFSQ